jgi:hypothetical protein
VSAAHSRGWIYTSSVCTDIFVVLIELICVLLSDAVKLTSLSCLYSFPGRLLFLALVQYFFFAASSSKHSGCGPGTRPRFQERYTNRTDFLASIAWVKDCYTVQTNITSAMKIIMQWKYISTTLSGWIWGRKWLDVCLPISKASNKIQKRASLRPHRSWMDRFMS